MKGVICDSSLAAIWMYWSITGITGKRMAGMPIYGPERACLASRCTLLVSEVENWFVLANEVERYR